MVGSCTEFIAPAAPLEERSGRCEFEPSISGRLGGRWCDGLGLGIELTASATGDGRIDINDDLLGRSIALCFAEATIELACHVAEHGAAAHGDAALYLKDEKSADEVVDVIAGRELVLSREPLEEVSGEILGIVRPTAKLGMAKTEAGGRVDDEQFALASGLRAVGAAPGRSNVRNIL